MPSHRELKDTIKSLRLEKRMSQKQLADIVNLSQQAVAKWEKGLSEPDSTALKKIASVFGVSVDYLLGRTDEKSAPSEEGALINNDPELTAYLEELSSRDELRMLFHVTKNATKEQIEAIVRMVESLNGKTDGKI